MANAPVKYKRSGVPPPGGGGGGVYILASAVCSKLSVDH